MNNNLLQAVNFLVDKKKVEADVVFDALEMVLLTAYKKEMGSNAKTSISLDRTTGEYKIYEEKTVVEVIDPESENAINEITVENAKKISKDYEAGDMLRVDVTPKDFGRVAAQAAKQVLIQKLREAERGSIYEEFSGREGDIITGTVKWSESRTVFVDLGRVEGILPFPSFTAVFTCSLPESSRPAFIHNPSNLYIGSFISYFFLYRVIYITRHRPFQGTFQSMRIEGFLKTFTAVTDIYPTT